MEKELNDLLEYEEPKNMDLKARQERINSYLQNWDNIRLKDVKQSELMDNDVVYVLTKEGKLYCDGNFIRDDIEELWCFDTYYIFLITKDKQIHTLQDSPFNKYFGSIIFHYIINTIVKIYNI